MRSKLERRPGKDHERERVGERGRWEADLFPFACYLWPAHLARSLGVSQTDRILSLLLLLPGLEQVSLFGVPRVPRARLIYGRRGQCRS